MCQVSFFEKRERFEANPVMVESPRYLAWVDRHEEAWVIIQRLHHDPNDPTQAVARAELNQITRQVAYDKTQNSGWIHMFVKPSLRRRTILVILLG